MSDKMSLQDACNATKQFGKILKGMERLQEVAVELENSEAVVKENAKMVASLKADTAKAKKDLDVAEAALAGAAKSLKVAEGLVNERIEQAKAEAAAIVEKAQKRAGELTEVAAKATQAADAAEKRRNQALAEETAVLKRVGEVRAAALRQLGAS